MVKRNLIYNIAGHYVEISPGFPERVKKMLQGFGPFLVEDNDDNDPLLQFIINGSRGHTGKRLPLNEGDVIHHFDIESGRCTFSKSGGIYYFKIEDGGGDTALVLEMDTGSSVSIYCIPFYFKVLINSFGVYIFKQDFRKSFLFLVITQSISLNSAAVT